ncbi:MAG: penicillin-binding transpeptidase domain-containing protein [Candidatus Hydrogenedentes bacterium]|nr:penicillin-binding transpeptidase domain-containing protein [Candidatus Hydrogenedentota bacterium]
MAKKRLKEREKRKPPVVRAGKGQSVRIRLVLLLFLLIYAGIAARLIMFQIDPDLRFADEELKHIGEISIQRPRGDIVDRNGRILATDRTVPSLWVDPSEVDDPNAMVHYLMARLGFDEADVYERVTRTKANGDRMRFVWLKQRMTDAEAARLGDINDAPEPEALHIQNEYLRYYPEGELAAQTLGFVNGKGQGEGIEGQYDKYLHSEDGRRVARVDGSKRRNMLGYWTLQYEPPSGGDRVQLTLDSTMQRSLELKLDQALSFSEASRAMGILMDSHTGDILALATRPAFDPNRYMEFEAAARKNRAVMDLFEPGSAFKIVTAAAALELGLLSPDDKIDCMGGRFNPYGRPISDTHILNVAPFSECFAVSSNIAIVKVASLIGPDRLEEWIQRFGFGKRSALGLSGESAGIFRPQEQWSRLSMGSLPMGQEIAVNILQLARAFSVIANGGYLVEPTLVKEIVSSEGDVVFRTQKAERKRILSEETARTMRELCYRVVSHGGTGSLAAIPEYRVGGKTGTAQIAPYNENRYTAVFAGFAPLANPRLTCVIVVHEPMIGRHYGGLVCGPVFKGVMRAALVQLNVTQDPMSAEDWRGVVAGEQGMGELANLVLPLLEPDAFEEDLDGLELIPAQEDKTHAGPRMPDFGGMTKREAKALGVSLGLPWDPQGAGRVLRQEPAAGTLLQEVRLCKLVFSNG